MLRVCIVGWYGTETLGDRSILAGILTIYSKLSNNVDVKIASLYPFYTKRTLYEDIQFYNEIAPNVNVSYFDFKNNNELRNTINNSNFIIMGGGPIMDLEQLEYVYQSFKYSKKLNKKTVLFGCGIGPLKEEIYKKITIKLISVSDLCIFRDYFAIDSLNQIHNEFNKSYNTSKCHILFDPAILPPLFFREHCKKESGEGIVMNLRKFDEFLSNDFYNSVEEKLKKLIVYLSNNNTIKMLPNHTFFVGGDDRLYFSELYLELPKRTIELTEKPLSLKETFEVISQSKYGIAMRYHAVLFQTILCGNNYILDYTEPGCGKMSGFINMIDGEEFYKSRYLNIQSFDSMLNLDDNIFDSSNINFNAVVEKYVELLKFYFYD